MNNNDIEVGEYIRTEDGTISKMNATLDNKSVFFAVNKGTVYDVRLKDIVKHSKKIIDLITKGDILRYKLKGLENEYLTVVKKIL